MLTNAKVRSAKGRERPYKLADGGGLTLLVNPDGSRWWRLRYRYGGREKMLSLGVYPDVSLALAREKRGEARTLLARGVDPSSERKAKKVADADTFKAIAEEWLDSGCPGKRTKSRLKVGTIKQLRHRLKTYVYPYHGSSPIKEITTTAFHTTLKRLVAKDLFETAARVRAISSRVFRYAIATGRAEADPAAALIDALPRAETRHFAAITDPGEIGKLLRAIDGYDGQPATRAALRLAPYVFVRPSELRLAEWTEIDLDASEWRIPAERTKMSREHFVPLSRQAVEILYELMPHTGHRRFVFPGIRDPKGRPLSENTLNAALRRLDYTNDQMVAHGFRTMASTRLNELGFDPDLIEVQLAHMDKDRVRAIYNRAEYIEKRRAMMQSWADYLDSLKAGASVTAIGQGR